MHHGVRHLFRVRSFDMMLVRAPEYVFFGKECKNER